MRVRGCDLPKRRKLLPRREGRVSSRMSAADGSGGYDRPNLQTKCKISSVFYEGFKNFKTRQLLSEVPSIKIWQELVPYHKGFGYDLHRHVCRP